MYCPAIPESLINATVEFRKGIIDEATHSARIDERRNYQIRAKALPDADGHVRVRCPASSPSPSARCEQKPKSEGGAGQAKVRIPVTDVLRLQKPKICFQESVTHPPKSGPSTSRNCLTNRRNRAPCMPPCATRTRA